MEDDISITSPDPILHLRELLEDSVEYPLTAKNRYMINKYIVPCGYIVFFMAMLYIFKLSKPEGIAWITISLFLSIYAVLTNGRQKMMELNKYGFIEVQGLFSRAEIPISSLQSVAVSWGRAGYILKLGFSPSTPYGRWISTTMPYDNANVTGEYLKTIMRASQKARSVKAGEGNV